MLGAKYCSKGEFPKDGEYVLGMLIDKPWGDDDDTEGNRFFTVVKFRKGISEIERSKLPDSDDRKQVHYSWDQVGNNAVPYCWDEFGPSRHFGQEIDIWFSLSEISSLVKE